MQGLAASGSPIEVRKMPEFETRLKDATEIVTEIFQAYVAGS
jgi:hypothetical protein